MIQRGQVFWIDLGDAVGSRPAKRRPVVVVQNDSYNASRLRTVIVAALTTNTALAAQPGNVFVPAVVAGLPRDSVVNVTALVTVNKGELEGHVGQLPAELLLAVDIGLRRVLSLA